MGASCREATSPLWESLERARWHISYDRDTHNGVPLRTHFDLDPDVPNNIKHALDLLQSVDPQRVTHINRYLRGGVAISMTDYALAWFSAENAACFIGASHAASASDVDIALSIVHETTHARIDAYGIGYDESYRVRIEQICIGREIAFARRLHAKGLCDQAILDRLIDRRAGCAPSHYDDARLSHLRRRELIQRTRRIGRWGPYWLRRIVVMTARRNLRRMRQSRQ